MLLRHFLGDHPDQSPRATALIARIEEGSLRVRTSDTVVFETVFTLERRYKQPKSLVRDALLGLMEMRSVELPGKHTLRRAFDLYIEFNLPFADAHHVALMERLDINQIITFDRDFDRVPGITKIEP